MFSALRLRSTSQKATRFSSEQPWLYGCWAIQPPEPMKAMLSLLLADLPGLPMANCGNAVLAATPVAVVRKVLRFMKSVVMGLRIVSCDYLNFRVRSF